MKRLSYLFALALTALLTSQATASISPVHQAVINHDITSLMSLISYGANVNSQDYKFGKTPLMLAAERGYTDMAEILVKAGAKLELRSRSRSTALHYAAIYQHADTFHYLMLQGANLWAINRRYQTPYGLACKNGWQDILYAGGHYVKNK